MNYDTVSLPEPILESSSQSWEQTTNDAINAIEKVLLRNTWPWEVQSLGRTHATTVRERKMRERGVMLAKKQATTIEQHGPSFAALECR